MVDYIDREELLKELHRRHWDLMIDFIEMEFPVVKERIDDMPSIDAVEVVRCKDCKHCEERQTANGNKFDYCKKVKSSVLEHFYCIWGEKE